MEEHVSPITQWFNHIFAPMALSLLHALHIQPADYDTPIPEYVVMSLIVLVVCTILAVIVRARLSVERPGALQQGAELLLTNRLASGIKDLLEENVAHGGDKFIRVHWLDLNIHFAFQSSQRFSRLSPRQRQLWSSRWPAPLSLSFISIGKALRHHGVGNYLLTFAGSPKTAADFALAFLLFPVELISTAARLLSLTVRLWANIFGQRPALHHLSQPARQADLLRLG